MSCNIKISVPIPDSVEMQGRYVAQALRELIPFIEQQVPLTEGSTKHPNDLTKTKVTWVCESDDPVAPEVRRRRRSY